MEHSVGHGDSADNGDSADLGGNVLTWKDNVAWERQHKRNISNEVINVINFFNIIQSIRDKYSWFQGDFYLVM